jgi:hypothetical protein
MQNKVSGHERHRNVLTQHRITSGEQDKNDTGTIGKRPKKKRTVAIVQNT